MSLGRKRNHFKFALNPSIYLFIETILSILTYHTSHKEIFKDKQKKWLWKKQDEKAGLSKKEYNDKRNRKPKPNGNTCLLLSGKTAWSKSLPKIL